MWMDINQSLTKKSSNGLCNQLRWEISSYLVLLVTKKMKRVEMDSNKQPTMIESITL
jgi:hypothetical protein